MTGLFFGSFNPIHCGHLQIASYLLNHGLCDRIWFIVSPQNPFKKDASLLPEKERFRIVETAISGDPRMKASDIEFTLPRPSYTVDTLQKLSATFPDRNFSLIIGADNLKDFHRWKDYPSIAARYKIFVYPRPGIDLTGIHYPNVTFIEAPLFSVSSTEIREKIRNRTDISPFVPASALDLILRSYRDR